MVLAEKTLYTTTMKFDVLKVALLVVSLPIGLWMLFSAHQTLIQAQTNKPATESGKARRQTSPSPTATASASPTASESASPTASPTATPTTPPTTRPSSSPTTWQPLGISLQDIEVPQGFFEDLGAWVNAVLPLVLVVAVLLTFLYFILGGLRWITSGGEKSKVADARNTIISAVVGLLVLTASFAILNLVLPLLGFESLNQVLELLP